MKIMNKEFEEKTLKEKISSKLGQTLIRIGEISIKGCTIVGVYEPKISVELIKSLMK